MVSTGSYSDFLSAAMRSETVEGEDPLKKIERFKNLQSNKLSFHINGKKVWLLNLH